MLQGSIDVIRRDGLSHEAAITTHRPGQFTGEVSQLAGRAIARQGRAGADGCTALPFDPAHLRALMIGSAEVGEIVMRAFILRRVGLIERGGAGSVLIGHPGTADLVRLEDFLRRNGYPYTVLDAAKDADGRAMVERLGVLPADLPLMVCPNGTVLKRPTEAEAGICLGITPELDPDKVYDVAVVGAGPAGLATAVYAASEGLSVIVLDSNALRRPGGRVGADRELSRLPDRHFRPGADGTRLQPGAEVRRRDRDPARGRAARLWRGRPAFAARRIALGAQQWRHGAVRGPWSSRRARAIAGRRSPTWHRFEGAGVSYWASPIEARLCEGEEVALVGGGNSAGQAVVFLAPKVKQLHLIVRGEGLEATMSRYLIDRIAALPNVELHTRTEIVGLEGERDTRAHRRDVPRQDDRRDAYLRHAPPVPVHRRRSQCRLARRMRRDRRQGLHRHRDGLRQRRLEREVLPFETSRPGVFAIGDVRAGSTKRVAAAVGEGAAVVAQIHEVLAESLTGA